MENGQNKERWGMIRKRVRCEAVAKGVTWNVRGIVTRISGSYKRLHNQYTEI